MVFSNNLCDKKYSKIPLLFILFDVKINIDYYEFNI